MASYESPPPSVCDYQVQVVYGTYRCMTAQQYQQYNVDQQAQATKAGEAAGPFLLGFFILLFAIIFVIPTIAALIGKFR